MSELKVTEFLNRYNQGEKDFQGVKLKGACLKNVNLSHINLSQADLSYADLSGANLSYANLKQAVLHHTNFSEANLTRANFTQANLSKARFNQACLVGAFMTKARLHEANLSNTQLNNAHFNEAELERAILDDANLSRAYLIGAFLTKVSLKRANLEGTYVQGAHINDVQFQGAYYNAQTSFDVEFDPIEAGMQKAEAITVEELLVIFNSLSQCSNKYLGKILTIKFWQSYRPNFDWFNQFEIDESTAQFNFSGSTKDSVSFSELSLSRKWMRNFINSCSNILNNFSDLVKLENLKFDLNDEQDKVSL